MTHAHPDSVVDAFVGAGLHASGALHDRLKPAEAL